MEGVAQPSGTVTLVFKDVEGSTRLLEQLGPDVYRDALGEHREAAREAFRRFGGYEVDNQGDSFFYAFDSAPAAVEAVTETMRTLESGPIKIRVGLHTGTPGLDPPKYVGLDVHRTARVMAAGHGGQVLITRSTRELIDGSLALRDLGEHRLKDFSKPVRLFQLGSGTFAPLKTISNTNLPSPASSFVGRDREVAELTTLLESGARLVTLTGPGGSGKTRLAIETASGLLDRFRGGVFWVELAPVRMGSNERADLVDAEHENGRTALQYLLDRDPAGALRLASALAVVWHARGRRVEGSLLAETIARAPEAPAGLRAKAHFRAGLLAFLSPDGRASFETALNIYEAAGDLTGVRLSRTGLGYAALAGLGWCELQAGDYSRARETLLEQLPGTSGDKTWRATVVVSLGWAELLLGNLGAAQTRLAEGMILVGELRVTRDIAEVLIALAAVRAATGDDAGAATLWGAGRSLLADTGMSPLSIELETEERWLEPVRAEYHDEYELGATLNLDEAVKLALSGP